jgi:hypothetical protein
MNFPTDSYLLHVLANLGNDTTGLGAASIGLLSAPFTPARNLTLSSLTEANYDGYLRQGAGGETITFVGADSYDYVQASTHTFAPTGSSTPNTIYGYFLTYGSSSTALAYVEQITPPVTLNGPTTEITITARLGMNPTQPFGNGVVSY